MSQIDHLKKQIEELQNIVNQFAAEEQRARHHEIIMLYDQLILLEEDKYFSYDGKARIHYHLKEYQQAEVCYLKMLESNPNNITSLWMLAQIYFDSKQYEKALQSLDLCIAHSFGSDFRYELRAKINSALGDTDTAAADQKKYDDYQAREQAKWDDPNHYYHYK